MNATEIEIAAIEAALGALHDRIRKVSDASRGDMRSVLEAAKKELHLSMRTLHVAGLVARDERLDKQEDRSMARYYTDIPLQRERGPMRTVEQAREAIALRALADGEHVFAREVMAGVWDNRHDVRAAGAGMPLRPVFDTEK